MRSMMHAYDDVDGVPVRGLARAASPPSCASEWGFDGIVVSDYVGIDELVESHASSATSAAAAALALEAGIDVELPSTAASARRWRRRSPRRVDLALVDRAVARVLAVKFELGLFEAPYVDAAGRAPAAARPTAPWRATPRARRSCCWRTTGRCRCATTCATIAVIGPNADSARNLLGDYAHVAHIETLLEMRDETRSASRSPTTSSLSDELERPLHDPRRHPRALSRRAPRSASRAGGGVLDASDAEIAEAVDAARGADVAIVVVGERSGLTLECTCGEMRDRMELGLPGRQEELVARWPRPARRSCSCWSPAGRWPSRRRPSVRRPRSSTPGCPATRRPAAIAEVLFGDADPGGKLPVTVPRHVGQVPIYYAHKPSGGRSHWHGDYVDGSHLPLWPFGHGLSYTRFALTAPSSTGTALALGDEVADRRRGRRTSASAPATRSSSSTCATWRRA